MINSLTSQFGNPTGLLGSLVGSVMAYENRERNLWAVSLLDIQPSDHILEIGFGPGLAIQQIAFSATSGFVAGVDQSAVMLRQASKRNAEAIQAKRVELKLGSVADLPYPDQSFDKAIVINSLHHWPDGQAGLREIERVLKPKGLLVLVEQPRSSATEAAITDLGNALMSQLVDAGFCESHFVTKAMKPAATVAALGRK